MLMPGRYGYAQGAGWVSESGGTALPQTVSYDSRNGNVPLEYKASQSIEFIPGFQSEIGDSFTAYITSQGSNESGNGVDGVAGAYRYGFNGKENDNEVKGEGAQQDYGFRIYDPRLGKFLSVDPLTDDYPELSTYQYASNNPVTYIDLDGLESAARLPDGSIFIPGGSDNLGFKYPQGARLIDVPKGGKDGIKNISNTLDNIPLVGSIKGGVEGAAGYDMEGNKLERGDRFLGVVPYVKNIKKIRQINRAIKAVDKADEVNDAAKAANKVKKSGAEKAIVKDRTDFEVTPDGIAVPKNQERMRSGFDKADFPKKEATKTSEKGIIHTVPTKNGKVDVRTMEGNSNHPKRAIITHPNSNSPKTPSGKATSNKKDNHIQQH
jgi:RHS repeat-associated protein